MSAYLRTLLAKQTLAAPASHPPSRLPSRRAGRAASSSAWTRSQSRKDGQASTEAQAGLHPGGSAYSDEAAELSLREGALALSPVEWLSAGARYPTRRGSPGSACAQLCGPSHCETYLHRLTETLAAYGHAFVIVGANAEARRIDEQDGRQDGNVSRQDRPNPHARG